MDNDIVKMIAQFDQLRSRAQRLMADHEELRTQVERLMLEQQRLLKENQELDAAERGLRSSLST